MSTPAGWFPDPDGTPGRLRWWDGEHWTSQTSSAPPAAPTRRRAALIAATVVLALVLAGGAVWLVNHRADDNEITAPPPSATVSGGNDGASPTPTASPRTPGPSARPAGCDDPAPDQLDPPGADGRVHGGPLSYPVSALPGWTGPASEPRVPYGRDAYQLFQIVRTETRGWASSVTVGVTAFDDFPGTAAAAQTMLQCIVTSQFYVDIDVRIDSSTTRSITVDGVNASRLDAVIGFDDPGLHTKGSRLWLIVVDTQPATFLFAAIPKESTDLVAPVEAAISGLEID